MMGPDIPALSAPFPSVRLDRHRQIDGVYPKTRLSRLLAGVRQSTGLITRWGTNVCDLLMMIDGKGAAAV